MKKGVVKKLAGCISLLLTAAFILALPASAAWGDWTRQCSCSESFSGGYGGSILEYYRAIAQTQIKHGGSNAQSAYVTLRAAAYDSNDVEHIYTDCYTDGREPSNSKDAYVDIDIGWGGDKDFETINSSHSQDHVHFQRVRICSITSEACRSMRLLYLFNVN